MKNIFLVLIALSITFTGISCSRASTQIASQAQSQNNTLPVACNGDFCIIEKEKQEEPAKKIEPAPVSVITETAQLFYFFVNNCPGCKKTRVLLEEKFPDLKIVCWEDYLEKDFPAGTVIIGLNVSDVNGAERKFMTKCCLPETVPIIAIITEISDESVEVKKFVKFDEEAMVKLISEYLLNK